MVEVRKEICNICGWSKIIVVREEVKYKPPRFGTKEILVCKDCQAVRGTPQFQEYYLIALRGTVGESGVVPARKKPESPRGPLAESFEKQVAVPLFGDSVKTASSWVGKVERAITETESQRIQRQGHLWSLLSPEMQAYVRHISYRSFFVGVILAAALVLSVFGSLIVMGVLHT